jgi:ABC-type transport system involved in multi-copper enzyme maturation permease subunit
MDLAMSFLGGENEVDVFTVLDGINPDLMSVAGEFGVDVPDDALDFFNEIFGDEAGGAKVKFLSVSPEDYYYDLNPARYMQDDLHEKFSDEMVEFILYERDFFKLLFNTEAIYKAIQDFSEGNGNALTNDVLKLLDENKYFVGIVAAALNLSRIIENSPVIDRINERFDGLKNPQIVENEENKYTLTSFYVEFFTAMLLYEGEVTPFNVNDVIWAAYEKTRLHTVHNVSAMTFFLATAPYPYEALMFYNDIYESGIFTAIKSPADLEFLNFLVSAALIFVEPNLTDEEIAYYLPEDYEDLDEWEKRQAYADAIKEAKFFKAKDYIFEYFRVDYPGFYNYLRTVPLFDGKTLKKLVPDIDLQAEILSKQADIIDTYIDIFAYLLSSPDGNYKELVDFVMYFAVIGDLHSALYSEYTGNMLVLRENLIRMKLIMDYFYNDGDYGKSAKDFVYDNIIILGGYFENLLAAVNQNDTDDETAYLELLTGALNSFAFQYYVLNSYISSEQGVVNFTYFPSKGALVEPEIYGFYSRQFNSFARSYRSVAGILSNPAKSASVKTESIKRFVMGLMNDSTGFFSEIGTDKSIHEKMSVFTDVIKDCYTAVISKEFFEENYAPIYDEIEKAFVSYFTVYKDESFFDVLFLYFDAETADKLAVHYMSDDIANLDYAAYRDISRQFTRRSGLIIDYVPKTYLLEVTRVEKLDDRALGTIYGMSSVMGMGVTKYSMKSDITKDKYYFENLYRYGQFTTATALDNGYGFMNFGFTLIYPFIMVMIIVIASGTIAGEYETGSIKLLLIRPYRRSKFLTSKFLFVSICLAAMFLVAYLSLLIIGSLGTPGAENWQGLNSRDVLVVLNAEKIMVMNPFNVITLEFIFYFIHCLMYAIIAVMISTVFRSRAASVAVSVLIFFASTILTALLSSYSWYRFIIFNNTDLFVYMSTGSSLADMNMTLSALIYAAYLILFLGISYAVFKKRDAV